MPRPKSPTLTDAELRLMEILWRRGPSAVSDVVDALPEESRPAYSTVLTTLRILEDKGYVAHTKRGRAFVYDALIRKDEARRSALRRLLSQFFGNSAEQLVLNVLENEEIDAEELARLRRRIAEEAR